MRKSLVVKLILMNSVLALAGCRKPCQPDDQKKDQPDQPGAAKPATCTGGTTGHTTTHYYGWGRPGGIFAPTSGTSRTTTSGTSSSVARGGFGSTGASAAS